MFDIIVIVPLAFAALSIITRDNVYSAISLAAAALAVALVYALMNIYYIVFAIILIYIGAVVLLILITASMFGHVERMPINYRLSVLVLVIVSLIPLTYLAGNVAVSPLKLGFPEVNALLLSRLDVVQALIVLFASIVASLLIAIETSRKGGK